MKKFENYGQLSSSLAFDLIDRLKKHEHLIVNFGASNQSSSCYVNISIYDSEDEFIDDLKIRFSDHGDRHGSDVTFRFEKQAPGVYDEGEYLHTEISNEDYQELLKSAEDFVEEKLSKLVSAS
jgi:hypothetical protein